jgi:hypothetical protein
MCVHNGEFRWCRFSSWRNQTLPRTHQPLNNHRPRQGVQLAPEGEFCTNQGGREGGGRRCHIRPLKCRSEPFCRASFLCRTLAVSDTFLPESWPSPGF